MRIPGETHVARLRRIHTGLDLERSTYIDHWREISRYIEPRLGRYFVTDKNKGEKRHQSVIDNTGRIAHRTLSAGLMSGVTSPARPWLKLTLRDRSRAQAGPVREWLDTLGSLMLQIFAASNTYRALGSLYNEIPLFGNGCTIVVRDFENVIHHYPLTIGSYWLGADSRGYINRVHRSLMLSTTQMVEQFVHKGGGKMDWSRVSQAVKSAWDSRSFSQQFRVIHVIEPRLHRDSTKRDAINMPFASTYFEEGEHDHRPPLSESGFKRFRALAPRWDVRAEDTYGTGPGMEALGDVKSLQHAHINKATAIDYGVKPPLVVPTAYQEAHTARLPGGIFFVDTASSDKAIRSAFDVNLDMGALREDIADTRARVRAAFFADLFLMMANDTRSGITATEVAERHEEKLLVLGPVLERLHDELLSPLISVTFDDIMAANLMPPAPQELQDQEIEVEFISTLAQAQRMVGAAGLNRLVSTVGQIAQAKGDPTVWYKINVDQVVDQFAEMYGAPAKVLVPDDEAAARREAEMQAMRAQQQAAQMPAVIEGAKTAGEIDTQGLQDVMNLVTGYNTPSPAQIV